MKKLSFLLIGLLISLSFAGKILDVPEVEQRYDQWCWAANSYSILTYYGEDVSQGKIVNWAYGDSSIKQWNWLYGQAAVTYEGKTYYPKGINLIMNNWNTQEEHGRYTLTESQWKQEIDNGNPFIIRWEWTANGAGHFISAIGYLDNNLYEIMDPWFGNGYVVESYDWVKTARGGKGTWTHTLTTDRSSPTDLIVSVTAGSGDNTYEVGETVTIIADEAPTGKIFDSWTGDISLVSGTFDSVATFTMIDQNLSFTATYKDAALPTYTVIASKTGNGTISPAGDVSVDHGDTVRFHFTADDGYRVKDIQWNDSSVGVYSWFELRGITKNHTINVDFEKVVDTSVTIKVTHLIHYDTLISVTSSITQERDTVVTTQTTEIVTDTTITTTDSLEDGISFFTEIDTGEITTDTTVISVKTDTLPYNPIIRVERDTLNFTGETTQFSVNDTSIIDTDTILICTTFTVEEDSVIEIEDTYENDIHTIHKRILLALLYDTTVSAVTEDTLFSETALINRNYGTEVAVLLSSNPVLPHEQNVIFTLPEGTAAASLTLFDMVGNLLYTESSERRTLSWDITNRAGVRVSSGSYVAIIKRTDNHGKTTYWQGTVGVKK